MLDLLLACLGIGQRPQSLLQFDVRRRTCRSRHAHLLLCRSNLGSYSRGAHQGLFNVRYCASNAITADETGSRQVSWSKATEQLELLPEQYRRFEYCYNKVNGSKLLL